MQRARGIGVPTHFLARKSSALPLIDAALLLLAVLCVRGLGMIPAVINPDESVFALAAREVLLGHFPYETLFDNKPIGSTLILAAAGWLLGEGVTTVRLLGALFVWLSALGIAALCRQGGLTRLQAVLGAALFIAFTTRMGGLATLTEILLAPFTVLAVLLLHRMLSPRLKRGGLLVLTASAGLACGGAVLIKIVPFAPCSAAAGCVLALLIRRGQIGLLAAAGMALIFGLFSAVPMLIAAGVYWQAELLAEFLYSNFGFAQAYVGIHPSPISMAQRLGTALDALWPLIVLAGAGMVAQFRRGIRSREFPTLPALATAWLAGELIAASASLQFFPHYFLPAVAPLAILSLFGVQAVAEWMGAKVSAPRAHAVLALGAAAIAIEGGQVELMREMGTMREAERIAAAIRQNGGSVAPRLFVTSYKLSALYSLTGSPLPPTRYAVPAHLLSRQSAMIQADPATEVARVLRSQPEYLVIDEREHLPAWAEIQILEVLSRDYHPFYARPAIKVYRADHSASAQLLSSVEQKASNH